MRWYTRPLCELADINPRNSEVRSLADEMEVSFVPMAAVSEHTAMIEHPESRLLATVRKGYTSFKEGDVLFAKITPCMENGKAALATGLLNGIGFGSTEFHVLRARHNIIPKYLFYFVRQASFRVAAKSCMRGAVGQQRVPEQFLAGYQIPFIPISEQHRIVEILDEADRLRRLRCEADAKAARILPALFLKMFGDPATNPRGWDMTTVGDIVRATDYGTSTRASDDGSGMPLIRMGNVDYNGHLDLRDLKHVQLSDSEVARFRLQQGDILFNRTNSKELVGKTGLWDADIDAVAASYFIRVRLDQKQVTPTFFWAFMNCSYMKKILLATARGAIGQANINSSELRAMVIYKPPLDQQHLFTKRWEQIRATIPQRIGDQTDLDNLFSTLLQHAFSGQLTAKWREAHSKELLAEMEQQARLLNLPLPKELETTP